MIHSKFQLGSEFGGGVGWGAGRCVYGKRQDREVQKDREGAQFTAPAAAGGQRADTVAHVVRWQIEAVFLSWVCPGVRKKKGTTWVGFSWELC